MKKTANKTATASKTVDSKTTEVTSKTSNKNVDKTANDSARLKAYVDAHVTTASDSKSDCIKKLDNKIIAVVDSRKTTATLYVHKRANVDFELLKAYNDKFVANREKSAYAYRLTDSKENVMTALNLVVFNVCDIAMNATDSATANDSKTDSDSATANA